MICVLRMKMWIDKFKAHLDLICTECGEELEGEWSTSQGDFHETIRIKPCEECLAEKDAVIDDLKSELEAEAEDDEEMDND